MGLTDMECAAKCRSRQHILQLINSVTKGSANQIKAHISKCHNGASLSDSLGRTVLHVAASCGKWEVVQWLLEERNADAGAKDLESGWTALHRALFYGQLTCVRVLTDYNAGLQTRDKEGLTPLDIVMKDKVSGNEYQNTDPNEVYTWGDNTNFTLGHDNEQRHRFPEPLDVFRKGAISIKQVSMGKYHSVFVAQDGRVFSCGHGQGGRLGHGDEQTYLAPKLIESLKHEVIVQVEAGRDHTVLLAKSGTVYSCGLNDCHQLGQLPRPSNSLVPKVVGGKVLKGKMIRGVCARRFHTVLYTDDAVYTCGLNAGQLGHQKVAVEEHQTQPRVVSALNHKDMRIKMVSASDAATVVVTSRDEVYVLHEYQCRRIISKWLEVAQVVLTGGHLDHSTDLDTLREKGGSELVILLRTTDGKVYIWRADSGVVKRCSLALRRHLVVTQVALSVSVMGFVTKDGEAFTASVPQHHASSKPVDVPVNKASSQAASSPAGDGFTVLGDRQELEESEDLRVQRIPYIHRATCITADRKGRNFAVLQSLPNESLTDLPCIEGSEMCQDFSSLLNEADEFDLIHDAVLKVGSVTLPVHKYILSSRSGYFRQLLCSDTSAATVSEKPEIEVDNVHPELFEQLLKFIYTDSCDLICVGRAFPFEVPTMEVGSKENHPQEDIMFMGDYLHPDKPVSAFEVQKQKKKKKKGKDKANKNEGQNQTKSAVNPMKMLADMARKFEVKALAKRLEAVRWSNGRVEAVPGRCVPGPRLKMNIDSFPGGYDVCIESADGVKFKCHKCVLVARLEYFHSMLASGWVETSQTETLSLPVPGDILKVVLNYLYTDDAPGVSGSDDTEFICNVLVVADQLLITRLKQICEVAAASLLNLKNSCEVLEFASMYNADQLKATCQQFICLNLAALVETRSLDVLSEDTLQELTVYYRQLVPGMSMRLITPYSDWPDHEYLEALEHEYAEQALKMDSVHKTRDDVILKKAKSKKKRNRTKSSGEETTESRPPMSGRRTSERTMSVSSDTPSIPELDLSQVTEERVSPPSPQILEEPMKALSLSVSPGGGGVWPAVRSPSSPCQPLPSPGACLTSPPLAASPQSAAPVGLRAIMEQETLEKQHQQQSVKSASTPAKKTVKLSQKERKRQQQLEQQGSQEAVSPKQTGATPRSSNPWGSVSSVVPSFKDLMQDEFDPTDLPGPASSRSAASPAGKAGGEGASISWGLPVSRPRTDRQPKVTASKDAGSPVSPSSPRENPWHKPSISKNVSFSDILKAEEELKESYQKNQNKPLALIQLEEQAMNELLQHYKADSMLDEHITVERVPAVMASPTWAAMSKHP